MQILRMLGQGKEDLPALGNQRRGLQQGGPGPSGGAGEGAQLQRQRQHKQTQYKNPAHMAQRELAPWKNSRVLKVPADMPKDFCTSLRAAIPVADCSVDTGRSAALWRKLRQWGRGTNSVASVVCNENLT